MSIQRKPVLAAFCVVCVIASLGSTAYYNSVIAQKDDEISSLKAQVASLHAQVDQLNSQIQTLTAELGRKDAQISELTNQISVLSSQVSELNSQIVDLNAQIAVLSDQLNKKPNLVVGNLVVEDDRNSTQTNLHIACRVYNTGGSTAYNAYLHVTALNAEGQAVNYMHSFTGITAYMDLGLDFRVNYTGSPITSWTVNPIWTDKIQTGESSPFA